MRPPVIIPLAEMMMQGATTSLIFFTSQREIENAIRRAMAEGRIKGNEALKAQMVLTIGAVGLSHKVDGTIELD